MRYNIFKRIHTGGLELSGQEIRFAIYQGNATKLIQKMAEINNLSVLESIIRLKEVTVQVGLRIYCADHTKT